MKVKPFRALRPQAELAAKIASVPYDVVDRNEAKKLAENNPFSFLHISRAEIDLPDDIDPYSEEVYKKAAENFRRFQEDNLFIRERDEVFYLYQLIQDNHTQCGLVACCSIEDYENNIIKKHEKTRQDKEDDRAHHIEATRSHSGPVFMAYRDSEVIKKLSSEILKKERPIYDFIAHDGVIHRVFRILETAPFIKAFADIPCSYIADGHHRAASAVRVAHIERSKINATAKDSLESDFFLSVLFPASELRILPYNRCVLDLNGFSLQEFLQKVKEIFPLKEDSKPTPKGKGFCSMYIDGKWYSLELLKKSDFSNPVQSLDVSILQNYLLGPVLGILDPRQDKRIEFIGGIKGTKYLEDMINSGRAKVAFSMYPITVEQMMAIADAGEIMPPKSTWFEPKLRDALFIHTF